MQTVSSAHQRRSGVRARPVLQLAVRLLRVRHVDRPAPSDRRLPRRRAARRRPRRSPASPGRVETVFVGGGTPSLVPPDQLVAALGELPLVAGAEVTVECNPDDVTDELLDRLRRQAGSRRISLGVQSMVPRILDLLGRQHDPDNVDPRRRVDPPDRLRVVQPRPDLRHAPPSGSTSGARRWNGASPSTRRTSPPTASPSSPARRSPPTRLATPTTTCRPRSTSSPTSCSTAAGLVNYEVSNWARPGHECRHNLLYWRQHDYLGFGCAAHSHVAGRRWWNVRTPERYIAAVAAGQPTEAAGETLDAETRRLEGLQLSLRTTDGVPLDALDGDEPRRPRRATRRPLGADPPRPPARQRGGGPPALITW